MDKHPAGRVTMLLLVACIALVSGASAGTRTIPSADLVPFTDWTYDALMSLAADGLVPGYAARVFQGDRLFNRMDMAGVVALVIRSSEGRQLGFKQVALIDHLVSEFKPELASVDPEAVGQWPERATGIGLPLGGEAYLLGYAQSPAVDEAGDDEGSSLRIPYRVSGFLNLSSNAFATATTQHNEERFFHQLRTSPSLDRGFVRGYDGNFVWSIGREYQNWGPAYSGSLILSDNAPALWQARGTKDLDFGKLIGKVKVSQFASTFEDDGQTLYLFGRRWEKPLSDRWHIGVSEAAKTSDIPNPLFFIVPFYLYEQLFIEVDAEFNALYAADFSYRSGSGPEVYGEFLIDDITAPGFWKGRRERPRKTGYTFGIYLPQVLRGERLSTLRAEYIYIDRLTYGATRSDFPQLAYTHDIQMIGSPIGPNAKATYLRGEQYLSDKLSLIGEYLNQSQTDPGEPERGRQSIISVGLAYDFAPDRSLAFRVAPFKTTLPDGTREDGTRYELRASFAL